MFEGFGEFDSAEELNKKAKELAESGQKEALYDLAKENGLDKEDVDDYMDAPFPPAYDEFVSPLMAAVGKIKVESKWLEISGILTDWKGIILQQCSEDEAFCKAVRKHGKDLKLCMAALIKFAFENKVQISDEIVKVTKVMHNGKEEPLRGPLYLGIPNNAEAKKIIREFYLG